MPNIVLAVFSQTKFSSSQSNRNFVLAFCVASIFVGVLSKISSVSFLYIWSNKDQELLRLLEVASTAYMARGRLTNK